MKLLVDTFVQWDKVENLKGMPVEHFGIQNPETKEFINSIIKSAGVGGVLQTFGKVTGFLNKPVKDKSIVINALGFLADATNAAVNMHITGKNKGRMDNVVDAERRAGKAGEKIHELDMNSSVGNLLKQTQQNEKGIKAVTDLNDKKVQSNAASDTLGLHNDRETMTNVENAPKPEKKGGRKKKDRLASTRFESEEIDDDGVPADILDNYNRMKR